MVAIHGVEPLEITLQSYKVEFATIANPAGEPSCSIFELKIASTLEIQIGSAGT